MSTVVIPFVPMPSHQNPNVRNAGADTYMASSVVTLASLRRWNPSLDLRFVTTELPDPRWSDDFRRISVSLELVPFDHRPPEGFTQKFLGSLYLLDILKNVEADFLYIVDPDVLCIRPLAPLLNSQAGPLVLDIKPPREKPINGLSPQDADQIHAALGEPRVVDYHYGGEFYGLPQEIRERLSERVEAAWMSTLDRWRDGLTYFTTEEHILNFALAGFEARDASGIVRRIWTARGYRTVTGGERELMLWHLPAEKERGFRAAYPLTNDTSSWFWNATQEEFAERSERLFSLRGRGPLRRTVDGAAFSLRALKKRVGQS